MRKLLFWVCCCLSGFLLFTHLSIFGQLQPSESRTVRPDRATLVKCVPELKNASFYELLYSTTVQGYQFHVVGVNPIDPKWFQHNDAEAEGGFRPLLPPDKLHWETTVAIDSGGTCHVLLERNSPLKFENVMPEAAARELRLQQLKQSAKLFGSLDFLQKEVDSKIKRNIPVSTVDYWAYQRMGVQHLDRLRTRKITPRPLPQS